MAQDANRPHSKPPRIHPSSHQEGCSPVTWGTSCPLRLRAHQAAGCLGHSRVLSRAFLTPCQVLGTGSQSHLEGR